MDKLTIYPKKESLQKHFENKMTGLGWKLGALTISVEENRYVNDTVNECHKVFINAHIKKEITQ